MRESLIAQIRNPTQAFVKRTRAINYGNCYYFQTAELQDLDTLDTDAACRHFNKCYKNPAEYTVCLTGQIEVHPPPPQFCAPHYSSACCPSPNPLMMPSYNTLNAPTPTKALFYQS